MSAFEKRCHHRLDLEIIRDKDICKRRDDLLRHGGWITIDKEIPELAADKFCNGARTLLEDNINELEYFFLANEILRVRTRIARRYAYTQELLCIDVVRAWKKILLEHSLWSRLIIILSDTPAC